mmetsp:Transcript_19811/g.37566  ORF Transcript_19811/g.37566 Transcript_19811/m.37566 type:complete len:421 (-) Transcript_19811:199-1461(-)
MARIQLTRRQGREVGRGVSVKLFVTCFIVLALGWLFYAPALLQTHLDTHKVPEAKQYIRYNKRGREVMHAINAVKLEDLSDLTDEYLVGLKDRSSQSAPKSTIQEASQGKQILLDELYRSGIHDMDVTAIRLLPTWNEVSELYYQHSKKTCEPIIFGLDKCKAFAKSRARDESFLATAGLYNTGTNALTYYMRANLRMAGNPLFDGVLVQVPWHKHWFVQQRDFHTIPYLSNISVSSVLPIVTTRDPFSWAQSMCDQPYDIEWVATQKSKAPPRCPSITNVDGSIRIPKQTGETVYENLFALWNAWYGAYLDSHMDFVMVRHEDLLYCPRKVLSAIQACSGASWTTHDFVYVMDQAKWEHARLSGRKQSNRVSGMIKHGYAEGRRIRHVTPDDVQHTRLNQSLLGLFGYHMPDISVLQET